MCSQVFFTKNCQQTFKDFSPTFNDLLLDGKAEGEENFIEWAEELLACGVQNKFHHQTKGREKNSYNPFSAKNQLSQFSEQLTIRNWTDTERLKGLHILKSRVFKVLAKMPSGDFHIFDGRQKGTAAYNKYYKAKIIDNCKALIKGGFDLMALTVTCSARDYNFNRLAAWSEYTDKLNRLVKQLARRFHCRYVAVLESTKKGFPHAHIVLGVPKGTIKGYQKMRNKQKFIFGDFYNYVKKFAPAKVFCLEKIAGKNTAWYLTKYISKYETNDFFSLTDKGQDFTTEERKAIDCLLYTTLCGTRQFRMSKTVQAVCVGDEQKQRELDFKDNAAQKQEANQETAASRAACTHEDNQNAPAEENCSAKRYDLIKRCIKLPECCKSRVMAMPLSQYQRLFGRKPDKEIEQNYKNIETFKKKGRVRGCRGCIYTHIYNFAMCRDDWVINPLITYGNLEPQRLFDGVDLNNDEQFIKTFEAAFKLIYIAINQKGLSLDGFYKAAMTPNAIKATEKGISFAGLNAEKIKKQEEAKIIWQREKKVREIKIEQIKNDILNKKNVDTNRELW